MPDPFHCHQQCPGDIPLQAMLGCASMPSSWPCQAGQVLLAGAREAQAPKHSELLRLFPQPLITLLPGSVITCSSPHPEQGLPGYRRRSQVMVGQSPSRETEGPLG